MCRPFVVRAGGSSNTKSAVLYNFFSIGELVTKDRGKCEVNGGVSSMTALVHPPPQEPWLELGTKGRWHERIPAVAKPHPG